MLFRSRFVVPPPAAPTETHVLYTHVCPAKPQQIILRMPPPLLKDLYTLIESNHHAPALPT